MDYVLRHRSGMFTEYAVIVLGRMFEIEGAVGNQELDISYTDDIKDATKFTFINDAWEVLIQVEDDQKIKFDLNEWDVIPYMEVRNDLVLG